VQHSPSVDVEVRDSFTPEMERLRREYADHPWAGGTSEDDFDRVSSHIVVTVCGELAGMVRVTPQPPSVLATWAIGHHHVPGGDGVVEANRGVVARKWRGMDLYKVLMAEVTRYCHARGVTFVVGAIEPAFPLRGYLEQIGFRALGEPTQFHNPPKGETTCQVIVQDVASACETVADVLTHCAGKLSAKGFALRSTAWECCDRNLRVDRDRGVLTLTLSRPEKLNALSSGMVAALTRQLRDAANDDSVCVVSVAGEGRAFSVGADLNELASDDRAGAADFVRRGAELVTLVAGLGKPVVASVGGHALGGGLELALGCTVRLASDRATFGLPEVRLGIMPGWGGTQRLARLCGSSRAALLALTGESIDAPTALAWGLVDRVVPHDSLADTSATVCRQLGEARQASVTAILRAVGAADEVPLSDGLRREADLFHELFLRPDTREAIAGFTRSRRTKRCT
jgi:enoyl-CoA hydratase/carnithine racemase/GNAT superfamily N-acetyltransferase